MKALFLIFLCAALPAAAQLPEAQTGTSHTMRTESKTLVLDKQTASTVHCNGGEVTVKGSNLHFTLTGKIRNLSIVGSGNRVAVAGRVENIHYEGGHNRVVWLETNNRTAPEVSGHGEQNETTSQ